MNSRQRCYTIKWNKLWSKSFNHFLMSSIFRWSPYFQSRPANANQNSQLSPSQSPSRKPFFIQDKKTEYQKVTFCFFYYYSFAIHNVSQENHVLVPSVKLILPLSCNARTWWYHFSQYQQSTCFLGSYNWNQSFTNAGVLSLPLLFG